jgi:hypothetical protein
MKNKKLLLPAFLPLIIMMVIGIKTMIKYLENPGDWHFIAAAVGVTGFLILSIAFLKKLSKK